MTHAMPDLARHVRHAAIVTTVEPVATRLSEIRTRLTTVMRTHLDGLCAASLDSADFTLASHAVAATLATLNEISRLDGWLVRIETEFPQALNSAVELAGVTLETVYAQITEALQAVADVDRTSTAAVAQVTARLTAIETLAVHPH